MSLKQKALDLIKAQGEVKIDVLYQLALDDGYRVSNVERRLRELVDSGIVKCIKNDRGVNVAYKYVGVEVPVVEPKKEVQKQASFSLINDLSTYRYLQD